MISWFVPHYWGKEKEYVLNALDSTWVSDGHYISAFEELFAKRLAVKNVSAVSNGTTALYLALLTCGVGPGDEVIVPGYTFAAPANMVLATGARPVFADIDLETWLINPEQIAAKITPKTKAIIPVHIYGNVCDMQSIQDLVKNKNIRIIEDVAEAAFSRYQGHYAGTLSTMGCFSFQATKTITMGEGGAVVSNDDNLMAHARLLRNHAMSAEKKYWHEHVGHNFRITNLQAALGYAQLEMIDDIIANKQRVFQAYYTRLSNIPGIYFQCIKPDVDPVIWAVVIRIDPHAFQGNRDDMMRFLQEQGVETRHGFISFDQMPLYQASNLPCARELSQNIISLPSSAQLNEADINYICEQVLRFRR